MFKAFLRFRKNLRDTRGISLLITMGFSVVLIIIATGVTKLVINFIQTTSQVERANIAYSAAEGGVELALYDLMNFEDGYQTDPAQLVCGNGVDTSRTSNFSDACGGSNQYRFANLTDASLSGGRGFWRMFARTLDSDPNLGLKEYIIPNPFFVGDRDGNLEDGEWGELTKNSPLSLSLLIDEDPSENDPELRFGYLSDSNSKEIVFEAGAGWDSDEGASSQEELLTWTLAALDGNGSEYTLQGVIWESDFENQDCDGDTVTDTDEYCFIFDLDDDSVLFGSDGDVLAGEDINGNLPTSNTAIDDTFNRVSGIDEPSGFQYATPKDFLEALNDAMGGAAINQWTSARLTVNLIATLSETSRDGTSDDDSLYFKLESDEVWADKYTYIISEGFAGGIKQTIETRFLRESAIPIFSYVIFQ